ncbi:MAG: hypothetical protein Q9159_004717 [Coniocarpon cinnabarinum]
MTSVASLFDQSEHDAHSDAKSSGRRSVLDDDNDLQSLHESSRHLQSLRNVRREDDEADEDSDASSSSAASTDSRRARRTKHARSRANRSIKPPLSISGRSAMSSDLDSRLPTLSRILEGRSTHEQDVKGRSRSARSNKKHHSTHHRHTTTKHDRAASHDFSLQAAAQDRAKSLVSPSLQSVLTSLTANTSSSSGSNGSNSTLTQSSYARSIVSKRASAAQEDRPESAESTQRRLRRRKPREEEPQPENYSTGHPDVFAFLEEDPTEGEDLTENSSDDESNHETSTRPQTPAMHAHRSSADPFVSPQPVRVASWTGSDQLHSDSGISVRGSSPESIDRRDSDKLPMIPDVEADPAAKTAKTTINAQEHMKASSSEHRRWSSASISSFPPSVGPQHSYAPMSMVPYTQPPPAYPGQMAPMSHNLTTMSSEHKLSTYDLLASRLSNESQQDGKAPPLYRRFGRLSHRMLLHFQDVIAELEDQLQALDTSIANCKSSIDSPESRRLDQRYLAELNHRRSYVFAEVFKKTQEYNQALMYHNTTVKQSQSARAADIDRYRDLTRHLSTKVPDQLRFLEHDDDLMNLSFKPELVSMENTTHAPLQIARPITTMPSLLLGPPAAMLVSFVMFSAASSWLVRMFLLVCFSGAGYIGMYLTNFGRDLMTNQERQVCLGFYICLLACIAATAG